SARCDKKWPSEFSNHSRIAMTSRPQRSAKRWSSTAPWRSRDSRSPVRDASKKLDRCPRFSEASRIGVLLLRQHFHRRPQTPVALQELLRQVIHQLQKRQQVTHAPVSFLDLCRRRLLAEALRGQLVATLPQRR